jgi:hypothetical protein
MPYLSLHGRAFGYDTITGAIQRPGFTDTFNDEEAVNAASTASNVKFRGVTTFGATAAKSYTMNAPLAAGLPSALTTTTTSTAIRDVTLASGNFQTTAGSSFTKATFNGIGQSLTLQALSTALVAVLSNIGATLST